MKENRNRVIGLVLAFLAVISASSAPVFIKAGVNADNDPITLLMLRLLVSSAIFWIYFSLTQPRVLRIDHKGLLYSSVAGVVNCAGLIMYYLGIQFLNVSVATMIFSFYPLFTIILLAIRGESIKKNAFLYLGGSLFGIYLFLNVGDSMNLAGALLVLGTTFGYALHLNIVQWYLRDYPAQTTATYITATMTILTTLVWLIKIRDFSPITTYGWISIMGTALLSTVLTRLALFASIRRLGSAEVSFFGPLEILLGVLWAVLFLGERLMILQWIGGFLVVISMTWLLRARKAANEN